MANFGLSIRYPFCNPLISSLRSIPGWWTFSNVNSYSHKTIPNDQTSDWLEKNISVSDSCAIHFTGNQPYKINTYTFCYSCKFSTWFSPDSLSCNWRFDKVDVTNRIQPLWQFLRRLEKRCERPNLREEPFSWLNENSKNEWHRFKDEDAPFYWLVIHSASSHLIPTSSHFIPLHPIWFPHHLTLIPTYHL